MPKNFDNFTDAMVTAAYAAMPTPNKVWIALVDEAESSIATSDAYDDLTASTAQSFTVTGVTVAERVTDLGGPFVFTGTTQTPAALVVLTDAPANSPDIIVAQNVFNGAVYEFADRGDLSIDVLLIRFGYQDET